MLFFFLLVVSPAPDIASPFFACTGRSHCLPLHPLLSGIKINSSQASIDTFEPISLLSLSLSLLFSSVPFLQCDDLNECCDWTCSRGEYLRGIDGLAMKMANMSNRHRTCNVCNRFLIKLSIVIFFIIFI
jgi:hypothetical protein